MTIENPLLRFGVIADPQYADIEPDEAMNRYYAASLAKVSEAIATFNATGLDFVITLGDIIDRGWENFDAILSVYGELRHKSLFLLGNHDFAVAPQRLGEVSARLSMPSAYHDFVIGKWRFVILDGNDVSVFSTPTGDPRSVLAAERLRALQAEGAANAHPWNGSLSDAQFTWLSGVLENAEADGESVLVLCHYPIFPPNRHNLWDSQRLIDLLTGFSCFRGYVCGHNHDGNFGEAAGRPFVTFKGMVETPDENTFAIVELFEDRIEIKGFGREESRTLEFKN
ncbi:MAG TPA: metallophosphoesterase [Pararhizobium sp.]|uniref:metallophosphoesterase n=1 Tax=Pararhizobium sp. TaxID=1977563 RepID=UPI002C5F816B|nr:metallophosphoesterase [Pararhizobium sp.]HTO31056.1 metallophosphoesterase [Pararhizobium sp.]